MIYFLFSRVKRFHRDEVGAVAVIVGMVFPLLVGGMALGTEAGYWYLSQRKLQHAADLAAYSAAVQLRSGRSEAIMIAAAAEVAKGNGLRTDDDTLVVRNPPANGIRKDIMTAAEVEITRQQTRYFTLIYDNMPVEMRARAVAEYVAGSNACLLALDSSAAGAITVSGSSEVIFDGCDVATNSTNPEAFLMSGGSVKLSTGCVQSVGGAEITSGLTLTDCDAPRTQAPVVVDPYADIAEPMLMGTCEPGFVGANGTTTDVTPSESHSLGLPLVRYCGGLDLKGTVNFAPGLYIVDGGSFKINASSVITGTDVTFFMTNGASLSYNGGASINLSAPTAGPLSGLLFFGDRDDIGVAHTINGTSGSVLNGAVYMPGGDLNYSGDFSGGSGCTQIVMRRVSFTGNSSLSVDCTASGTRRIAVGEMIALIE